MKMEEFLALSDDEKVAEMTKAESYDKVTSDLGKCYQCGKDVNVGDFCFGCKNLVCSDCIEIEPHYSDCLNK